MNACRYSRAYCGRTERMGYTNPGPPPIHAMGGGTELVGRWYGVASEQSRSKAGASKERGVGNYEF